MKDDFYKDIEHKRASRDVEETAEKSTENEEKQTMKRSDRHRAKLEKEKEKQKQKQETKAPSEEQKSSPFADIGQKLTAYFNRENFKKGKVFFAGKLSTYNKRFRDELNVSKAKLSELGSKKKSSKLEDQHDEENDEKKKGLLPIILGGALLLPVTIILFVMIISNFWPTGENGSELAGGSTEDSTEESSGEQSDEEADQALEEQKAEMEKELAEKRDGSSESDSDSDDDLGTGDLAFDYSEKEQSELEDAASAAIEEKESGEDTGSDTSEVETAEEQTEEATEEQTAEEQTEEPAEEESTEESSSNSGSHVVSAEDNLYRIAIRYYGSGSSENVNKIMEANGVSPDTLTVGEELVIPE